ncbi:C2 domain-containing protein [Lipomyces arxii]|uniref:C2 domain-containing protein n=1 Tax=Lipomyces arxii TaxID=56418 RepID=UPI0034CFB490
MSLLTAPSEIGTLILYVIKKNLPNRRTLGKQDPYCLLRIGQNAQSSNIDKRGGQRPVWNHEVRFQLSESDDKVKVTILDDNDTKPELIGDGYITLDPVLNSSTKIEYDQWHEIQYRSKYAGEVLIQMTFYPNVCDFLAF